MTRRSLQLAALVSSLVPLTVLADKPTIASVGGANIPAWKLVGVLIRDMGQVDASLAEVMKKKPQCLPKQSMNVVLSLIDEARRSKAPVTAGDLASAAATRSPELVKAVLAFKSSWSKEELLEGAAAAAKTPCRAVTQLLLKRVQGKVGDLGAKLLGEAAGAGNLEVVEWALRAGVSANAMADENGWGEAKTPAICFAAAGGSVAGIERLLRAGADPSAYSMVGEKRLMDPLTCALATPHNTAAIAALIKAGAELNTPEAFGSKLHAAAQTDDDELVTLMLDRGANPNAVDKTGRLPIDTVAYDWSSDELRRGERQKLMERVAAVFGDGVSRLPPAAVIEARRKVVAALAARQEAKPRVVKLEAASRTLTVTLEQGWVTSSLEGLGDGFGAPNRPAACDVRTSNEPCTDASDDLSAFASSSSATACINSKRLTWRVTTQEPAAQAACAAIARSLTLAP